jgi:hypothetical protein
MLRWKYEKNYEKKHGAISSQFRSFSFLIHREVAEKIHFEERYSNYGYEDVKYGNDLKAKGYIIHGIDNPLMNKDIEENDVFLKKTEDAISNAYKFREELKDSVTLIQVYNKYKIIMPLVRLFYIVFKPLIKKNLLSSNPSLFLFSFYKLGYYSNM